jgi:hypothetical protein
LQTILIQKQKCRGLSAHSHQTRRLTQAFALGLDAHLAKDRPALESWAYLNALERDHTKVRHQLEVIRKRFERISDFHREAIASCMRPQPTYEDAVTRLFDADAYRTPVRR